MTSPRGRTSLGTIPLLVLLVLLMLAPVFYGVKPRVEVRAAV
jgi:hypothetical protein